MAAFTFPVLSNVSLAPYTYIKIGGPAEYLYLADSSLELEKAIKYVLREKFPFRVLGGGSNILISDSGLPGLTIINRVSGISHQNQDPGHLLAAAGTPLNLLVNYSLEHDLAGLAGFLGIPGTVGGAVFNNCHSRKHLFDEYVSSVNLIDSHGTSVNRSHDQLGFTYDYSVFQDTHDSILQVNLKLIPADHAELAKEAQETLLKRRNTQPLEQPSSGCFFKNLSPFDIARLKMPTASVGYLIDQAGLKGTQVGGAKISQKHANFIVNTGSATAQDVYSLSQLIMAKIYKNYSVNLETEVFLLGEFKE
jgi:UDP-N-acetylmuramate dehydrogenase